MKLFIPDITADMSSMDAALAYAEGGFYVVPVKRGTKNPGSVLGANWQRQSSRDIEQIIAWMAGTDYDLAVHCGRSGAVCFDVDRPAEVPAILRKYLGAAPFQSSRPNQLRRGHYLFAQPAGRTIGNRTGRLGGAWGEVRGLNGVIMVAPSHHKDGGIYQWQRSGVVPVLPAELADALDDADPAEDAASDEQVRAFITAHTEARDPGKLNGLKSALLKRIESGQSRHDAALSAVTGALKEARAGYYPAATALETLQPIFLNAVQMGANKRTPAKAESEWRDIVAWAVGQASSADLEAVRARAEQKMPNAVEEVPPPEPTRTVDPVTLPQARAVFRRWFGESYDTDALDVIVATVAVERFDDGSDPLWLLIVGGPGAAKTESVHAASGVDAIITSAISSEAALLSATPKKERSKAATGGLLRKIGERGVLVVKDVTSILSMNRDLRARVLAALREVYDGSWYREVGTDGGLTIPWHGRIAVIGAVTTAWDAAHAAVASMGDRFVLLRLDSTEARQSAGRQAIGNTGSEETMRAELAAAVAGVIAGMDRQPINVSTAETDALLAAADLVTLARTGVEYDYRGDVIDAHAPEMPTRFAKQLTQIVRGAVAVGMPRADALRLAIRCARDSMPPLRLAIIDDLATHPRSSTAEVRKRIDKPRNTVDRQLQALHILGVVAVDEDEYGSDGRSRWFYSLAAGIRPDALDPKSVPDLSVHTPSPKEEESEKQSDEHSPGVVTDISGTVECRHCGADLPAHMPSQRTRGYCSRPDCLDASRAGVA